MDRPPSSAAVGSRRAYSVGLVIGAIGSVQLGAALATTLFDDLGPAGTVLVRVLFAAVALLLIWRPVLRGHPAGSWRLVVAFGIALAGMNFAFYGALDRIPLGIAVTLEFIGPLGVAIAYSRRPLDGLWVIIAAIGILLLAPEIGGDLDAVGAGLALLAGVFWGGYIVLSARVGQVFPGGTGLALAMAVATVILLPGGLAAGSGELLRPELLAVGAAIAMLSSAIPYSLELEALRRLPAGTFGVLMSLEPAVAALVGLAVLGQSLGATELVAIALVVAASAGTLGTARAPAAVEA